MKLGSRTLSLVFLVAALACVAGSAEATAVRFLTVGAATGFDSSTPGFPTTPNLVMDGTGEGYLAGATPGPEVVQYSQDHCLLVSGKSGCQSGAPLGTPYTDIVTLTLESTPASAPPIGSGLYILIAGMTTGSYTTSDVTFETTGSTSPPVDPLLYARLDFGENAYHYFGLRFTQIGESRTVRYDVSGMAASGTPIIFTSGYYPVPEPGTGALLALGVLALATGRRR